MLKYSSNGGDKQIKVSESNCVLMVCPDNRKFNSSRLKSCIKAINSAGFSKITLLIADGDLHVTSKSVSRSETSYSDLHAEAEQESSAWEEKNRHALSKLKHATISHWDKIIYKDSKYGEHLKRVEDLYEANTEFQSAINHSVRSYLEFRFKDEAKTINKNDNKWQNSLSYKRKEVAGLFIKAEMGFTFLAYPGELCPGLQYALKHFVQSKNPERLIFLKINIEAKNQQILMYGTSPLLEKIIFEKSVQPSINGTLTYAVDASDTETINNPSISESGLNQKNEKQQDTNSLIELFGIFKKQQPIFTEVEFYLQNCKSSQERVAAITVLQGIIAKYMMANVLADQQQSKTLRVQPQILADNGVVYRPRSPGLDGSN